MTRVYLVRHCEAEGNKLRRFQGITDCDITATGQKQLEQLSMRFKDVSFDKLYASPLIRSYKTAEAVNRFLNLPIEIEPGIKEINGGEIEGICWEDFPKTKPVLEYNWNVEPHKFNPRGGETMTEVYHRANETLDKLVAQNRGKTIVLVSHGCVIRNIICRVMKRPFEELIDIPWADNTGIFLLEFDAQNNATILLENDCAHLSEDLLPSKHRIGRISFAKTEEEK